MFVAASVKMFETRILKDFLKSGRSGSKAKSGKDKAFGSDAAGGRLVHEQRVKEQWDGNQVWV